MKRTTFLIAAFFVSALALAACGSALTIPSSLPYTSAAPTRAMTKNRVVTPTIRKSLLDAAAKYHQLPPSDYVSLVAGTTYYAYDPTTKRYYAAAGLIPSPKSLQAQVGTQDDGSYNLFTRSATTSQWTVVNDGLGGIQGATCPLALPASVLAAWHWKAGSCFPPSVKGPGVQIAKVNVFYDDIVHKRKDRPSAPSAHGIDIAADQSTVERSATLSTEAFI